MTVLVIETASLPLRGQLCKWMLEAKPGVFIGKMNPIVREALWNLVKGDAETAGALLIFNAPTEIGLQMEMYGEPTRSIIDLDGLQLIKTCENG